MRTLRLSLAGTVILALLGGPGAAVVAQDEPGRAVTATHVRGEVVVDPWWGEPESETKVDDAFRLTGLRVEREVEWSDPRLPSTMVTVMNIDEHYPADIDVAWTWARVHRLDRPDGSWLATERGIMDRDRGHGLLVWTGEDAYEGLSAVLVGKETDMPGGTVYEGYIFEGELPAFPEPTGE